MKNKGIIVENLTKNFGTNIALQNVSFTLQPNDILGIVGPNGSGKTTLMNVISGLITDYRGKISIDGVDASKKRHSNKKILGCLIESPGLYPNLTGYQNLDYFSAFLGKNQNNNISYLIKELMLDSFIHKKVKSYSFGMKQRLGLAVAMMGEPDYLLLDEPTNGLDPEVIPEIRTIIRDLSKNHNCGVMISSHILSEIESICTKVLVLKRGVVVEILDLDNKDSSNKKCNFVISSKDILLIKEYLKKHDYLIRNYDDSIIVMIPDGDSSKLLRQLIKEGFSVDSIFPYQESLETKFLEVIKESRK